MALKLPLELQQHIADFLDPRSFYNCRQVCRWWAAAAGGPVALSRQLRKLPITPEALTESTYTQTLLDLYTEAAHTLLLGSRIRVIEEDELGSSQRIPKPKLAISADGRKAASLDGRQICVYDLTCSASPIVHKRPLNDLRTGLGAGPWFKCAPTCIYELALSKSGRLLAVALERTIQIYDLEAGTDSCPASAYISSAAGHFIAGIAFEHNDSVLRVQLSNKGTILYLGHPVVQQATLGHWAGDGGLKHVYLDSSEVMIARPHAVGERFSGTQLLRRFEDGWLFAAQRHRPAARSDYCLGYAKCIASVGHATIDESSVTILCPLSTSCPSAATEYWTDLPQACEERHPHFSLSPDGSLLALAEACMKPSQAHLSSKAFVYRLPRQKSLQNLLNARSLALDADIDKNKERKDDQEYIVDRLPIWLGEVRGSIMQFAFSETACAGTYSLRLSTELDAKTWTISGC